MARRTKEDAEHTRNAILDAAEALFFERGVARTTLDEVARSAGVSRGAVYWHFQDKVALFEAMQARARLPQEDLIHSLLGNEDEPPLETLCGTLKEVLHVMATDQRRRRVFTILFHRCEFVEDMRCVALRKQGQMECFLDGATRLFELAAKRGELRPYWAPASAALSMHALMIGLLSWMLEESDAARSVTQAQDCVTAFFRSLSCGSGQEV